MLDQMVQHPSLTNFKKIHIANTNNHNQKIYTDSYLAQCKFQSDLRLYLNFLNIG